METRFSVRSFDSPLSPAMFQKIPRNPVFVILDNIRSAFNVGSIFRTADGVLVSKLYLCGITAHPPHPKLEKTALGVLPFVPWEYRESTEEAISEMQAQGIRVVALETTDQSRCIWEYRFSVPICLVLGNEVTGLSESVLSMADEVVEIPVMGYKNSINVAVAFGIAVAEIQRQHWGPSQVQKCVQHHSRYWGE